MLDPLKILVIFLTLPLLYSCQKPLRAQESHLENKVAYAQATHAKHTKHIRKQQRNIHDRLRKIRERMEKKKKRKARRGR